MTVLDWQGTTLWQMGEPEDSKYAVHGAFAFNVADVDFDGRTEILATRDFKILIIVVLSPPRISSLRIATVTCGPILLIWSRSGIVISIQGTTHVHTT